MAVRRALDNQGVRAGVVWTSYYIGASDRDDDRTFPYASKTPQGGRIRHREPAHRGGARLRAGVGARGLRHAAYDLEGAYQFGRLADEDISASSPTPMSATSGTPLETEVTLLGNIASGDRNPNDGEINTFDPLYGTTHATVRPHRLPAPAEHARDCRDRRPSIRRRSSSQYRACTSSGRFEDGLVVQYTRFLLRAGRHRPVGRDLGQEIDFTATYKLTANAEVEGGYAHFFDGRFADKNGRSDPAELAGRGVPAELLTAFAARLRAGHGLPDRLRDTAAPGFWRARAVPGHDDLPDLNMPGAECRRARKEVVFPTSA